MRFSVLGFRSDIRIELQAPVPSPTKFPKCYLLNCKSKWMRHAVCFVEPQISHFANFTLWKIGTILHSAWKIRTNTSHISCQYLRNRSALAVNCWVIIHCLEVSCIEDQITSAQREWFIFVQLTDKQWIIDSTIHALELIYFDSNTQ